MNKVDQEIISILKDVFQLRFIRPMESDHNLRLWMIRSSFFVSALVLLGRLVLWVTGHTVSTVDSSYFNYPITIFFTLLFLHINSEVEDTRLLMFILTWISRMFSIYL